MRDSHTDSLRRLAMQIAIQLPDNVAEAERTLQLTRELLDKFMVAGVKSQAHSRAARLGWGGLVASGGLAPPDGGQGPRVGLAGFLCCVAALYVTTSLGAVLFELFGAGAIACNMLMISSVSLVFGRRPALLCAVAASFLHNFFLVPPIFAFSVPGRLEFLFLGLMLLSATLVPFVAERRERLRARSLAMVRRPALVRRLEAWVARRAA